MAFSLFYYCNIYTCITYQSPFNFPRLRICQLLYIIVSYIDMFLDLSVGRDGGEAVEGWIHCK